ncbi:LAME_0G19438g1_1 [Lachancea meyersii CBS 8951]|uniref:LAME_0G19438g1_1 n=1 Tax=Lachancea meyersii CBS 8951 TaxID=1266667 RepID=A0A1G4KC37_9SACH|nr:LAME_0G19438g1_1 [Lachancea meyersii CBS 8951]
MARFHILFLCVGLIVTGGINSLFTKYQDNQCVRDCKGNSPVFFNQPVLQTLQMFIGEMAVLAVFWSRQRGAAPISETIGSKPVVKGKQHFLLAMPAICDIIASTLLNLALIMIPVSIYQMTRGGIVFFVALFSVLFLKRRITHMEWVSLVVIVLGVAVVGYSGQSEVVDAEPESVPLAGSMLLGICSVVLALVFMAFQFIIEEHIMARWQVIPLGLVGFEGLFGSLITFGMLLFGHVVYGQKDVNSSFNMRQAFKDMLSNGKVLYSSVVIMVSIACFNYFGTSITKNVSATSRSTVDTCRTLLVWLASLSLGWESFKFLQLFGFMLLVAGTLVFNGAIEIPDKYLPQFLLSDKTGEYDRLIDTIDEEVERF